MEALRGKMQEALKGKFADSVSQFKRGIASGVMGIDLSGWNRPIPAALNRARDAFARAVWELPVEEPRPDDPDGIKSATIGDVHNFVNQKLNDLYKIQQQIAQ